MLTFGKEKNLTPKITCTRKCINKITQAHKHVYFLPNRPRVHFLAKSGFKITKTRESARYDVITSQNVCETSDDHSLCSSMYIYVLKATVLDRLELDDVFDGAWYTVW